jgi:hypothetical protein
MWEEYNFRNDKKDRKFYDFVISHNFRQKINKPTMFRSENINDILLVKDDEIITPYKIDNKNELMAYKIIEFSINWDSGA